MSLDVLCFTSAPERADYGTAVVICPASIDTPRGNVRGRYVNCTIVQFQRYRSFGTSNTAMVQRAPDGSYVTVSDRGDTLYPMHRED